MKTKPIIGLLSIAFTLSAHAGQIQFQLSPAGTDVAVGLSPSNQVPAVTNSTGSGNTISGGIVLDTSSNILHLAIGYGSAAGFTDLTGVPIAMHIHSPGATNQNANVLVDLSPYNFPAANPTNGGVIFGAIAFPTNSVSNLVAGLSYVNIHTALNPGGEIRGQLIPVIVTNSPPSVACPPAATVECGTMAHLISLVSDMDGDALTVVWTLNGAVLQTNTLPANTNPAPVMVSFIGELPLGTNTVGIMVTDSATNTASCSTTITVVDTTPPVIGRVTVNPLTLWPPNHKMVDIRITAQVTDTCGPATWKILSVTSNEPVTGGEDEDNGPDWIITGDHTLQLRAERSGKGKGRIYSITIQASDQSGNHSTKVVTVTVPHNK
jgi:hypothetical protein